MALERINDQFLSGVGYERQEIKGGDVYATRFTRGMVKLLPLGSMTSCMK